VPKKKKSKYDFNENARLMIAAFGLLSSDDAFLTNYRPILDPKHWEQPELRWLVGALVREFDKTREAPGVRVLKMMLDSEVRDPDEHKLLLTFIEKMQDFEATEGETEFVYDKFEGFIQQRAARWHLRKAMDMIEDGDIDRAIDTVNDLALVRLTDEDWIVLPETMPEYFSDFDEEHLRKISVPIGLPSLDSKLEGGLRPGELGVFLAPTGYGKSMALVQVGAEAFRKGKVVIHISFENSEEETRARYTHNLLQMDSEFLRSEGREGSGFDESYAALKKRYNGSIYIKELVGSRTTMNDLDALIGRLLDREIVPGLIVVDYGDKMRPVHEGDNKYEDAGTVFDELRDLANIYDTPLWTATQSNRRGLEAKKVRLEHTSDSMGKMMNADVVISIGLDAKDRDGHEIGSADEEDPLYTTTTRVFSLLKIRRSENKGWWMKADAILSQARFAEVEGENFDDDEAIQEAYERKRARKSHRREAEDGNSDGD
jgi:hypothetical protein